MKWLVFDTEDEAAEYSHGEAIFYKRGGAGMVIQYWYSWRETANGKWAVQCPDGTEAEPVWKIEVTDETN